MALATAGDALGTQHLNGFVLVPTLHALAESELLARLASGDWGRVTHLTPAGGEAPGPGGTPLTGGTLGAFRTLALAGWASLRGTGAGTQVRLTETGMAVAETAAAERDLLADVAAFIGESATLLASPQPGGPASERLARLARRMADGWGLSAPSKPSGERATRQVRTALDGALVCPVIVAAGMCPDRIAASPGGVLPTPWHDPAVAAILVTAGLAAEGDRGLCLTEAGAERVARAADYGVVVSYARILADLGATIGGKSVRNTRFDADLARHTNIWGSAGHTVLRRLRDQVIRDVLLPLFDTEDLDSQPAGLADTGCGSGIPLRETADLIIRHTRRGQHLSAHPLLIVGGDISPKARAQAEMALHDLSEVPGVRTLVLTADVGDPDSYDALLRERCAESGPPDTGLADLLHLQMFLLHDRELTVHDEASAQAQLRDAISACSSLALADALDGGVAQAADLPAVTREFTVDQCDAGMLVPALVAVADLVGTVRRWRPYLRHGLIVAEAHVPRVPAADQEPLPGKQPGDAGSAAGIPAGTPAEVDPAPAVWGVHAASGQFLLPREEHELAMVLGGLACAYSQATGTGGVSVAHWVHSEEIYQDHKLGTVPDFAFTAEATG
jgi:hypothetical protein